MKNLKFLKVQIGILKPLIEDGNTSKGYMRSIREHSVVKTLQKIHKNQYPIRDINLSEYSENLKKLLSKFLRYKTQENLKKLEEAIDFQIEIMELEAAS